jgi:hypothetical protein
VLAGMAGQSAGRTHDLEVLAAVFANLACCAALPGMTNI